MLSVNSARSSSLRNADLVSNIVNSLPKYAKIFILASDRQAFTIASNPWPDRIQLVDMPRDFSLTIWPQDPFVVLQDNKGTRLLASPDFDRADDREMAQRLSELLELPLEYSPLAFEGGNIVTDDEHVFIGANTIRYNALELEKPETDIVAGFEQQFGKRVIVVGPVPQPIGHIDMMLTPLGGKRLLLADPGWGARIAALDLEQNPQAVSTFETAAEANFFGLAEIQELTSPDGGSIRPPRIVGATAAAIDDSRSIAATLDTLAASLEKLGFEIYRMPYLQRLPDWSGYRKDGATIPVQPGYPQMTYNNVLLEATGEQNIVYMPTYGWEAFDDAAAAAWRELGYRVVKVPGFTTSAMYGGALRCSVKVLARF